MNTTKMKRILNKYKRMPLPAKASLWFLACSFFQKALSTITTPLFTRIMTNAEYGQFGVFNSWLSIISPIICLNLASGVFSQGLVKFEEDRKRYASSLQGLCLTLVLIWALIYIYKKDSWNSIFSLNTVQGLSMMLIIWTNCVFSFWSLTQRIYYKYKGIVILTSLTAIAQPFLSIFLILNSTDKVTARILGIASVQIVLYVGLFVSHMIQGKQFFSRYYWKYAIRFNLPLIPHYLSLYLLSSSDRIMISKLVGDSEAGIYNLAHSLSLIMTLFNTALLQTIEPWMYRKIKENKTLDISKVAYPCFIFIAAVNILLILFAPEAIALFAPPEYKDAIWLIPSLSLSVYFTFIYNFFANFEFYFEKKSYIVGATMGGAILNIILNYIFIKKFGYIAAGYTTLFSYIVFALLHYYFSQRICNNFLNGISPYNPRIVLAISVGTLIMGLSIQLIYPYIFIRYTIIGITCIYIIVCRKHIVSTIRMILSRKK